MWRDEQHELGEIRRAVEGVGAVAAGHGNVALAQRQQQGLMPFDRSLPACLELLRLIAPDEEQLKAARRELRQALEEHGRRKLRRWRTR